MRTSTLFCLSVLVVLSASVGCRSPYYADQGALLGGVTGAGIGAAIGSANGNSLPGAVIGTAVGVLAGSAIGEGLDEIEARNRALIEERLGRQVRGAVTSDDIVAMSQAGLSDDVIVTHIRANGVAAPPTAAELISLNSQGVSDTVIKAMQNPPPGPARVGRRAPPRSVVVEEHYYGHPYPSPYWYDYHHYPRHGVNWGISFQN